MNFLSKIFGDPNKKELAKFELVVEQVNSFKDKYSDLADAELKGQTEVFKERLESGESLEDILPEAFALVKEAAFRAIGQTPYDEQLLAGLAMHKGMVVEQKTGEGKTLAATLPLYLNALTHPVHLITVNDYLARRDASWMAPIYDLLGLSIGVIQNQGASFKYEKGASQEDDAEEDSEQAVVDVEDLVSCSRKEVYACDVIYGTNNEFGFDYLRDNMAKSSLEIVQSDPRKMGKTSLRYAIIDEVDSILIDEARTPLIISAPAEESGDLYQRFSQIVLQLNEKEHYSIDEKDKVATINDAGIEKIEKIVGVDNIYDPAETKDLGGISLVHHLEEALKAEVLFKKDRDYVVKDGEVIIVDEFTGRLMPGRRYSEGLHQAIEAKEKVEVQRESITLATISFQNLFRLYDKLAGMTGTALTEAEEFHKIYKLSVIEIPTHKPMIREDLADLVYKTVEAKLEAVAQEIQERSKKGQPILVGTISIERSEYLSKLLKKKGVKHEVLNAKHHEREAKIISKAGQKNAVTIATNMAGRGVDIALGSGVKELGGLFVLGTERHEARRIDNQLRGRSGRQGDPGASRFYLSLDDDLMRIFGGDRIKGLMDTLRLPEDQPIENKLITNAIERAQHRVEGINFDIRKHLLDYDDVLNKQREVIYKQRRKILSGKYEELKKELLEVVTDQLNQIVEYNSQQGQEIELKDIAKTTAPILAEEKVTIHDLKDQSVDQIKELFQKKVAKLLKAREQELDEQVFFTMIKQLRLQTIDQAWINHLTLMDELRQGIGLRGIGQQDPLLEYKKEGHRMFFQLMSEIDNQVAGLIFNVKVKLDNQAPVQQVETKGAPEGMAAGTFGKQEPEDTVSHGSDQGQYQNVGRNDPCPCGSNKKFKKCHGK